MDNQGYCKVNVAVMAQYALRAARVSPRPGWLKPSPLTMEISTKQF
ncbi:MAG: hypothetical protein WBV94_24165 [Blastocatellia bacterium]